MGPHADARLTTVLASIAAALITGLNLLLLLRRSGLLAT